MKDDEMLYCLIAFILGWFLSRHMGNGFSVGGQKFECRYNKNFINFANHALANDANVGLGTRFKDELRLKLQLPKWCKSLSSPSYCNPNAVAEGKPAELCPGGHGNCPASGVCPEGLGPGEKDAEYILRTQTQLDNCNNYTMYNDNKEFMKINDDALNNSLSPCYIVGGNTPKSPMPKGWWVPGTKYPKENSDFKKSEGLYGNVGNLGAWTDWLQENGYETNNTGCSAVPDTYSGRTGAGITCNRDMRNGGWTYIDGDSIDNICLGESYGGTCWHKK